MSDSSYLYVTYIRTTPDKLWAALTTREFIRQWWFGMNVSCDWRVGARWQLHFDDGRLADSGEILEVDPPKRLVIRWRNEFRPELAAEGHSRCTMLLEPRDDGVVKLTIAHRLENDRPDSKFIEAVSGGWPMILSNLKSLLETGEVAMPRK
jgi:uncharacterized protein YndB with AHSA1/START domain